MLCNFDTLGGHLNGYKVCYSKSQFDIKLNIIDNNKFYLFKFVLYISINSRKTLH